AALPQLRVSLRGTRPALDAACGLETRDRLHEIPARDVVGRGERLAVRVVWALLGDGRPAERAADGDAAERARLAADLLRDDRAVCVSAHAATGYAGGAAATAGSP